MVLERHERIGSETSSRNSEVIHAGLYYPTGSLRSNLCTSGKKMLYHFCAENGVTHKRCGKVLVATTDAEIPKLEAIAATAAANGVADLRRLSRAELRELEPELECVAAYLSPSTGILDSHGLMQALLGHIASDDGTVVLNTLVTSIALRGDTFAIETSSSGEKCTLTSRNLVLAAGLNATVVGGMLAYRSGYSVPVTYPARGHYFALSGRSPFRHLVYPIPIGAWLGVHLTIDVSGRARFGPDIEWCNEVDYMFDEAQGRRLTHFEREIRRYWPSLPEGSLHPDSVGVRPKLYREGEPPADFRIDGPTQHGVPGLVALYGIESPGLTSSLAIGEHVARILTNA